MLSIVSLHTHTRKCFPYSGQAQHAFLSEEGSSFLMKEGLTFVFACEHPGVDSGTLNVDDWVLALLLRLPGEGVEQT